MDWRQCKLWLIEKTNPMRKNQKVRRKGGRIRTLTWCGSATAATMEQISSTAAIPSGGGGSGRQGDDQGSRSGSLGFGARRFEDEISKRRGPPYIYPSLSVMPILCFRCHRVPQLSADRETRCNREYEIGVTENENQINPRHSVRPRFWGWLH